MVSAESLSSEIPAFRVVCGSFRNQGLPARSALRGECREALPCPEWSLSEAEAARSPTCGTGQPRPLGRPSRPRGAAAVYFAPNHPGGRGPAQRARRDWASSLSIAGDFPRGGAASSPALPSLLPRPCPPARQLAECCGAGLVWAAILLPDPGLDAESGALSPRVPIPW